MEYEKQSSAADGGIGDQTGAYYYPCVYVGSGCTEDADCPIPQPQRCKTPRRPQSCGGNTAADAAGDATGDCSGGNEGGDDEVDDDVDPEKQCYYRYLEPLRAECRNKACRVLTEKVDDACDCYTGCVYKNTNDEVLSCLATSGGESTCQAEVCGLCGEKAKEGRCCGSGLVDKDGLCHCPSEDGLDCDADPSNPECRNK